MRVLKTSLHCLFWVNMLDDVTCGSNKLRITKQECCMVGSMPCNETAAASTGSDEYQVICSNNGIGNTIR
ncbi:hypothetical protein O0I10_013370 [Lichtheimia ornata]|uniref:Secreted protein n=1 Tax=Lichtheimia ornata TaxID=688661 RepID=A0AAD7URY9_9FUNG|nr:uncharacterized protein O0I10_013370 [Lichtheimia ornata]KAJ8651191.1 hypothetical protein O0I10_013370 [Lichtheimia ornata]